MFPYFTLFGTQFGLYPTMALVGAFVAGIFFCRQLKKAGRDENDGIVFLLWAALGVYLGGALLYGITHYRAIPLLWKAPDWDTFLRVFKYVFGGSVFYGGLIGGSLVGLLVIKLKKLDRPLYLDLAAMFIPLFHSFARVGCFLGGCCYGVECDFGFTAHGNDLVPAVNDVSRFPVQLLESLGCLGIFFLIFALYRKKKLQGRLLFVYLGAYAVLRFSDEFLRGDAIRGFVFGLSTSQFISIFIALISLIGLTVSYCKTRKKTS